MLSESIKTMDKLKKLEKNGIILNILILYTT